MIIVKLAVLTSSAGEAEAIVDVVDAVLWYPSAWRVPGIQNCRQEPDKRRLCSDGDKRSSIQQQGYQSTTQQASQDCTTANLSLVSIRLGPETVGFPGLDCGRHGIMAAGCRWC